MTDRRKIDLIKKDLGKDRFNELIEDIPKDIENNPQKLLTYMLNDYYALEMLVDNEKLLTPMLHTEFLVFIMNELDIQGAKWKGAKGFFELLVPDEEWEEHKKSWFSWLNPKIKDSSIRKTKIKSSIQDRLNFSPTLWYQPEDTQIKVFTKKIEEFLAKDNVQKKNPLDLSSLIKTQAPITYQQKEILKELQQLSQEDVKRLIVLHNKLFIDKRENQAFLLEALLILYKKSYFEIVHYHILPFLFPKQKSKFEIIKIEADVLTNLTEPNYDKIINLLQSVNCSKAKDTADIQTMIISNLKRSTINHLKTQQKDLGKLLLTFSKHYYNIYKATRPYGYYPAINLAYMVTLFNAIFPNHKKANSYDLDKIYKQVKNGSIKIDKRSKDTDNIYYATITDLEFRLLFGHRGIVADMNIMLDQLNPNVRMIEQTLGQMRWFLEVLEKFSRRDIFLDEFVWVMELLEGYCDAKR